MPRVGRAASDAMARVRDIAADASTAAHLAERVLAALARAIPFDAGAVFLVDPESLLLTRLLAQRGYDAEAIHSWVRDVYLVVGEPAPMHFPTLLRENGGVGAYHPDPDQWLRVAPTGLDRDALARGWHDTGTPAGGFLRYGIAHRRRWVGALQLTRLESGAGFRRSEVELLDRTVPAVGRALGTLLAEERREMDVVPVVPGRVCFGADRRVASATDDGLRWLSQLAEGDGTQIPLALQALVSQLAGSGVPSARVSTNECTVLGEVLVELSPMTGGPSIGYCLSIDGAAHVPASLTQGQWSVAQGVGRGLSDKEIAGVLGIATSTVHERVASLHDALGTCTRAQLVAALAPLTARRS